MATLRYLLYFLSVFSASLLNGQNFPRNYFAPPLNIPLHLSGNFGEMRPNHFHTGLDFKTQEKEGFPVLASADGYVSRIKVSAIGYGLVVYIAHPNGYTTAYAHLQSYSDKIADVVLRKQYQLKSFEVDFEPKEGELKIKKGEIIGLSGNSGSSGGPHLHFEIRETKSEKACNPLLFGINLADSRKPTMNGIMIYALSDYSQVDGLKKKYYNLSGENGNYQLATPTPPKIKKLKKGKKTKKVKVAQPPKPKLDTIKVHGDIGFALHVNDMLDNNSNICGVYSIEMYFDDTLTFSQYIDKIDFAQNRCLNAHTDYIEFRKTRKSIHKCYLEPNNQLSIYPYTKNRGLIKINDDKLHKVKMISSDAAGNTSVCEFFVKGIKEKKFTGRLPLPNEKLVEFNKNFTVKNGRYEIDFPANNIYKNEYLKVEESPQAAGVYSNIIRFGNDDVPMHTAYGLKIATKGLPDNLKNYAYLAELNSKGKAISFLGNKKEGNFIVGKSRAFGSFGIVVDSVPPSIRALTPTSKTIFNANEIVRFTASDAQSGLNSYNLYIDGTWELVTYDAKYKVFSYLINPNRISDGEHSLRFVVSDNVGNERTYESKIIVNNKISFED